MEEIKIEYNVVDQFNFVDETSGLYDKLYNATKSIEETYPSHRNWFYAYFIDILLKNNEAIIVYAKNSHNNEIAGVAFLNRKIGKLNTLFVGLYYRRKGIANQLLETSEKVLGIKPMITVSEDNLAQLKFLFERRNYKISYKVLGYYKKGKYEFCFNDDSSGKIFDNPKDFYDYISLDENLIPTFVPKQGKDYQSLFGKSYSSRLS